MPTEPIRMYFHDASTDSFVTCSGMSMADVIVVASIAIHMKPTLFDTTENSIMSVNKLAKMRKSRARAPACTAGPPQSHRPPQEEKGQQGIRPSDEAPIGLRHRGQQRPEERRPKQHRECVHAQCLRRLSCSTSMLS